MGQTLSLCIAQINYDSEHIQAHVERIKGIIRENRQADLIVFPELILHGHPSVERPEGFLYRKMKVIYSTISQDMYHFIKGQGARVIFGELRRWGDRYYNLATYVDADSVQSYVKCHVHWTENFVPGKKIMVFDTPLGRIGISICFDAAFSETWRVQALLGADLMVNIAAVPGDFPVKHMWRRMVGAAAFNQCPVIYANRPGDYFAGHSAVFGPDGDLLFRTGGEEAILRGELDMSRTADWRQREVIMPNRRPLLYRAITSRGREGAEQTLRESRAARHPAPAREMDPRPLAVGEGA